MGATKYGNASYDAAKIDPTNWGWAPPKGMTADREIVGEYETIVSRCREQIRNNAVARAILASILDFVAPTGLTPTNPHPLAEDAWNEWAQDCHISGSKHWDDVYRDIVAAQTETGDLLAYFPMIQSPGKVKTRIDLIEGDRIKTPSDVKEGKSARGFVRHGVVFDDFGQEIGYYVSKIDPRTSRYKSGDASNFHYFEKKKAGRLNSVLLRRPDKLRPGETRQLPIFVTILQELKDNHDLWQAAIERARSLSLVGVILSSDDPEAMRTAFGQIQDDDDATLAEKYEDMFGEAQTLGRMLPGSITTVPFGTKIDTVVPSGSMEFETLIVRNIRILGAALGFPLELALRDFSQTNYSAGKLAHEGVWRLSERWNAGNSRQLAGPLFKMVAMENWLRNEEVAREVPTSELRGYLNPTGWMGGPRAYNADPAKESIGDQRRMDNNLTTEEIIAAQNGVDWRNVSDSKKRVLEYNIKKAQELAETTGVPLEKAMQLMLRVSDREILETEPTPAETDEPEEVKEDE